MRNELHLALIKHLQDIIEQCGNDKEQLNELYSVFDDSALSTLNALRDFADLLYWYGIDEDGGSDQYQHINAGTLISVGVLLKNNLDMLNFALNAKDKIGNFLYSLTQGE
ncbi:hypothetical protein ACWIUA_06685 [Ursidibacter sp. B-7004-1]